jgi:type IV secretion system protein VirB11
MNDGSALAAYLAPIAGLLADPALTELCVNRPGEAWFERDGVWTRIADPALSFDWAYRLVTLLAARSHQKSTAEQPLLSASLPGGERVQAVLPPACAPGHVVLGVRRPSSRTWSLDELAARGVFGSGDPAVDGKCACERMRGVYEARDWQTFLRLAVKARQTVLVSGATGSGKTTLTKALCGEIPAHERLVTIEDAPELPLHSHPNRVALFYSKDGQGQSRAGPKQLLEASLRLRPDRILLAELRGEEAYEYLRAVSSGHPGSITSIHAGSPALAFEQLGLLVKESQAGRELKREEIRAMCEAVVDIVVQCERSTEGSRVADVWWRAGR